jgi:hypothetical protein
MIRIQVIGKTHLKHGQLPPVSWMDIANVCTQTTTMDTHLEKISSIFKEQT